MKLILVLIATIGLIFILSLPSDAQPRNLQVRITEVKKDEKKKKVVQCIGVLMDGDSVKVGHRHRHGSMKNCLYVIGNVVEVEVYLSDEKDCVYYRKSKVISRNSK